MDSSSRPSLVRRSTPPNSQSSITWAPDDAAVTDPSRSVNASVASCGRPNVPATSPGGNPARSGRVCGSGLVKGRSIMKPLRRILELSLAVALVQACHRDDGPLSPNASRVRAEVIDDAAPSAGTWNAVASMPTARFGLAAATGKHGIIYALGGSIGLAGPIVPTVEAYDQMTGSWSAVAPMPTPRRYLMAATDRKGRIYAIGGALAGVFRSVVERYDPATDTWSVVSPLPVALCCGAATTGRDGRIYVIGGFANGNVQLGNVEAYDPETDTWTSLAPLPAPRAGKLAAVTAPDGRIYAIGGVNGVSTVATMEAYDPSADTWTAVAPLSTPRGALAAAVGRAGTIFAIGGFDGSSALSSIEAFTPGHLDMGDEESDAGDAPAPRCEDSQARAQ